MHETFEENLKVVDEDFGCLPPLSLAYAAALAEQAGHEARIIDTNVLRLGLPEVERQLREFRPHALAFTLSTYMFHRTTAWMKALRASLGVPTIAGGINVQLYPEETIRTEGVDYGILHFGIAGFPALLKAIEEGRDPVGLPEVVALDPRGRMVIGPVDPQPNPYLALPLPARHLLPNHRYYSIISQRRNFTVMVTSTGCPARCRYCAIPSRPRYLNPVDRVIAEIRQCHDVHGIREIDFFDADFFADRRRARLICQRLIDEKLDIEWSCRASIGRFNEDLLRLAQQSGCRAVYLGIETPEKEALVLLKKNVSPDQVREQLQMMRRVGVRALGFFMLGVPGETHASAARTIRYALGLPIDYAQFSRMIPKPGSDIHREHVEQTGSDYWRDLVGGRPVPPRAPNPWSRISEEALENWTKLAYLAFYYRPSYILKALARLRSTDEAWRSFRTMGRMLKAFAAPDRRSVIDPGPDTPQDARTP
jgi:radical SAM superfamily enzyme YgiQ (UPF0313 family)